MSSSSIRQSATLGLFLFSAQVYCRRVDADVNLSHGYDLESFVTCPDLRAPKFVVTNHIPDQISPGYWFISPYGDYNTIPDRLEYIPYQVGPYIYDSAGQLVWSGADLDSNRNAHDFRTYEIGDEVRLSYTLSVVYDTSIANASGMHVIMDSSYNKITALPALGGSRSGINAHEFKIVDNGTVALHFATKDVSLNATAAADQSMAIFGTNSSIAPGRYQDDCIVQTNLATGEQEFEWCGLQNGISPDESMDVKGGPNRQYPWDYMLAPIPFGVTTSDFANSFRHANSIDRFSNGDFLVSARHTSAIYRISRTSKTVTWRLGGKKSDFQLDFNFSSQHDARILSENQTTIIMTMLDNASDNTGKQNDTALASSAKKIAIYYTEVPMRAILLQQLVRPDGRLSRKRGNVQTLPNDNILVGWSHEAYMSEYNQAGELLSEARLTSPRFGTYRSYKLPFVGKPQQPPIVKAHQFGGSRGTGFTNFYVSWNGATEVSSWSFMGTPINGADWVEIAKVDKTGFETKLTSFALWDHIAVVAFDSQGNPLATSNVTTPEMVQTTYADNAGLPDVLDHPPQEQTSAAGFLPLISVTLLISMVSNIAFLMLYKFLHKRYPLSAYLGGRSAPARHGRVLSLDMEAEKRID